MLPSAYQNADERAGALSGASSGALKATRQERHVMRTCPLDRGEVAVASVHFLERGPRGRVGPPSEDNLGAGLASEVGGY